MKFYPECPSQAHFYSFQKGEKALYCDLIKVVIMFIDSEASWDCDAFLPYIGIAYLDKNGVVHSEELSPREVLYKLSHIKEG